MNIQSHFHFVGINGIGMSAIAKILYKQGHIVSGCDLACDLVNVQELIDAGCKISSQHNSDLCHDASITRVVYSSDVPYESKELVHARSKGIATVQRAAILAEIMNEKYSIGIAGSHGKTTTTAMIGHILTQAKLDPTIIVGGIMNNINNNARYGVSNYVVAETDESDRSHLLLPIKLAILTNIDFEHANTYKSLDEVIQIFKQFLDQTTKLDGHAILCADDQNIATMMLDIFTPFTTYGTKESADIQSINISLKSDTSSFEIIDNRSKPSKHVGSVSINLPSIYNVLNATAAISAALHLDIPFSMIAQALASFQGVDRRFTLKGIMKNPSVEIYDDYGHHPTEIYHSLITARRKTKNKLTVVFQPQRYTRTFHLWNEFVTVFANSDIDNLIITDIYTANEPFIENVTAQNLVQAIKDKNQSLTISYVPFQKNLDAIQEKVIQNLSDNDLLLLLGAGKVNSLAEKLL